MDMELNTEENDDPEYVEVDPSGRYGRYKEELGRGAQKIAYKAFDMVDGIEVAWYKCRIKNEDYYKQEQEHCSEVELLKNLKHKSIIKYYTSWVIEGSSYVDLNIITEIFTSGTLKEYRKKHKNAGMKAVKSWARQILRGLVHLHSHEPPIIHRDLKCDNIFVNGNQGEVKIGDFGLAVMQTAKRGCSALGTFPFMAPEMFSGKYNELVDVYGFGMCILELVTLDDPYCECQCDGEIFKKIIEGKKPASLDKVKNPEVRAFIEKCITHNAAERPSATELLDDPWMANDADDMDIDEEPSEIEEKRSHSTNLSDFEAGESTNLQTGEWFKDFKLEAELCGDLISLDMRFTLLNGKYHAIQFQFDEAVDTPLQVAREMSEQDLDLGLSKVHVPWIAKRLEDKIASLYNNMENSSIVTTGESSSNIMDGIENGPQIASIEDEAAIFGHFEEVFSELEEHGTSRYVAWSSSFGPIPEENLMSTWAEEAVSEAPDIAEGEDERVILTEGERERLTDSIDHESAADHEPPNGELDANLEDDDYYLSIFRDFNPPVEARAGIAGDVKREHYDTGQVSYGFLRGCGYSYALLPKNLNGLAKNGVCVTAGGNNVGGNKRITM